MNQIGGLNVQRGSIARGCLGTMVGVRVIGDEVPRRMIGDHDAFTRERRIVPRPKV